jgi:hypothetical protein
MSVEVLHRKEKNMFKTKLLAGVLLVFMLLTAQVGMAAAAPLAQDVPPITGTIQDITTEADANGETTVLVTLLLEDQTTQTVRISLPYAVELGLIDPTTQEPVPLEELTEDVTIDANQVIPDEEPAEEAVHPIAALLAAFFDEDPSVVNGYHEDGFGFGVIAQALWLSQSLTEGEDASAAGLILEAKQNGDYSEFSELFDGLVPTNWGQFKKALRENKDKHNLGTIVSGQAENDSEDSSIQDTLTQQDHGNGNNKDKGKNKNKNKNHP